MKSTSKNFKNKKNNERENNIKLLKKILNNRFSCIKSIPKTRPNSPNKQYYDNLNIENIEKMKI